MRLHEHDNYVTKPQLRTCQEGLNQHLAGDMHGSILSKEEFLCGIRRGHSFFFNGRDWERSKALLDDQGSYEDAKASVKAASEAHWLSFTCSRCGFTYSILQDDATPQELRSVKARPVTRPDSPGKHTWS